MKRIAQPQLPSKLRSSRDAASRSSPLCFRRPGRTLGCLLAGGIALFQVMLVAAQPGDLLQLVQTIALPDVRGRIDHLDIDLDGGRLFVAALGNNTVEVVDLRVGQRSARIGDLREAQGVAYAPAAKRLFIASGGSGRLYVFAADTLAPVARIDALEDADNIRYEPMSGRLYVGYGRALAALEAPTAKKVGDIKLAGHPESFQLESTALRMFVNVPSSQQIAVVDRRQGTLTATWNLGEMRAIFPMALDEIKNRLFVATRRPAAFLVYDTEIGKRVANIPICGDADDLFFDGGREQVYAICGEGVIDVLQQQDADHYEVKGRVRTAPGARTGLFVATQGLLYVAVPAQQSRPAEIRIYKVN